MYWRGDTKSITKVYTSSIATEGITRCHTGFAGSEKVGHRSPVCSASNSCRKRQAMALSMAGIYGGGRSKMGTVFACIGRFTEGRLGLSPSS
jgi:hypothetical protein